MRYFWKDGFYIEGVSSEIPDGAVEISETEYRRLLDGEGADGRGGNLEIYTREDGYPDLRLRVEPPETPAQEIARLKWELSSSDYRIIKCSEAQLLGAPMPYDVAALHTERQALRDRINELEG